MREQPIVASLMACVLAGASASAAAVPGETPAPQNESPETPETAESKPAKAGVVEAFPGVRVNVRERWVEFDGIVPIVTDDERAPVVILEVLVCTPDTKEHETLVMTRARPSHVHAALLLCGAAPGSPGRFQFRDGRLHPIAPRGDRIEVRFVTKGAEGERVEHDPFDWITDLTDKERRPLTRTLDASKRRFVFAGSQMIKRADGGETYDADMAGTLVGLATFQSETVAWAEVFSPDSTLHEPELVARASAVPPFGTEVTVRLRVVSDKAREPSREEKQGENGEKSPPDRRSEDGTEGAAPGSR